MKKILVKKNRLLLFSALLVALLSFVLLAYFYFYTAVDDYSENSPLKPLMLKPGPVWEDQARPFHQNIYWKNLQADGLEKLNPQLKENQDLIISLFAMARPKWNNTFNAELQSISQGHYDAKIEALAKSLRAREAKTYLLLNPMPEIPLSHYPWQMKSPQAYLKAFQHFSKKVKEIAPQVQIGYATAGYPGVMEYFPGDDYLDFSALVLQPKIEKQLSAYPPYANLQQELKRKLHRLRFSSKPVLVLAGENLEISPDSLSRLRTLVEAEFAALRASMATLPALKQKKLPKTFKLGLYDPEEQLLQNPAVNTEHLFMNMRALHNGPFKRDFAAAVARQHQIIVTAEPWGDSLGNANRHVFRDMLEGRYDSNIRELFAVLKTTDLPVYLRFAHEMEIPIERYGWQSQDPLEYIKAYRYFWTFEGGPPVHAFSVWGPAGDRGSMEWYPGDDVVDYISIAIYGLPDKDIEDHRQQEQFSDIFKRKVWRMRFANAPIFITEFGVKGPATFQRKWLVNAAQTLNQYPQTAGACYFNLHDNPEVWGSNIETPNWSINSQSFQAFVNELKLD